MVDVDMMGNKQTTLETLININGNTSIEKRE